MNNYRNDLPRILNLLRFAIFAGTADANSGLVDFLEESMLSAEAKTRIVFMYLIYGGSAKNACPSLKKLEATYENLKKDKNHSAERRNNKFVGTLALRTIHQNSNSQSRDHNGPNRQFKVL